MTLDGRKIRSGVWYLLADFIGWIGDRCDALSAECALWSYRATQRAYRLDPAIIERGRNNGSRW